MTHQPHELPPRAAFRDVLPSNTRPADFPAGLPFVPNQAVTYAAGEHGAQCIYPVLAPGALPDAPAHREPGLRGVVATVRDALAAAADAMDPDPAGKADVDDLCFRIVAAAAELGWTPGDTGPEQMPPTWRRIRMIRPGERLEILSTGTVVTVSRAAESVA